MKDPSNTKHGRKQVKKEHKQKVVKSLSEAVSKLKKKPILLSKPTKASPNAGAKAGGKGNMVAKGWKAKKQLLAPKSSHQEGSVADPKAENTKKPVKKPVGFVTQSKKRKPVVNENDPAALKKYRQSIKPNFELIEKLKADWNRVRERKVDQETKESLVDTMLASITGRIVEITLRHDASRVIQYLVQHSSPAQRQKIVAELVTKAVEICKTPYGHFAVLKAITYCTDPVDRKKLLSCLNGHFVAVGSNVIGARTVESVLQLLPPKLTRPLKAEFYGRKFITLLPEPPATLRQLIEQLPSKATPILDHMKDLLQRFVDKGLLEFTYVHNLLWEYAQEIIDKSSFMTDLVNQLLDAAPKLMSTKPGAKVICLVATYSGAKERKRLLKSLKGKVLESLLHTSAHLSIMRLIDVTDDTVNVQKSLLDEIKSTEPIVKYKANGEVVGTPYPALVSIAKHYFGRKLLLRLLNPSKRCLEPDEELLFAVTPATSKKSSESRRNEHLVYLKHSLLNVCGRYAEDLLRCPVGHKVLEQVVFAFFPAALLDALVKVYTNQAVVFQDLDEAVEDGGDAYEEEGEEEGEEEEGEYDEDREAEGDDEAAGEEDEEVGDHDEEDAMDDAEEEDQEDEDAIDTKEAPVVPLLDIEEDPSAHNVLRYILGIEGQLEGVEVAADKVIQLDNSLWDQEEPRYQFGVSLVSALVDNGLLSVWIQKNRSCLSLLDLLRLPSCSALLFTSLAPLFKDIETCAKSSKGAKLLLEFISTNGPSISNLKSKSGKKKITN